MPEQCITICFLPKWGKIIKQRKDHVSPKRPGQREVRGRATRVRFQRQRGTEEAEKGN